VSQHAVSGRAVPARPVALGAESPGQVLHPGDVVYAGCGERLQTLLGSCVAIILTDPRRTVATMCHVVHAGQPNQRSAQDSAYGEVALAAMARLLRSHGITPGLCEA
jgi:chemotaxis protein CheD